MQKKYFLLEQAQAILPEVKKLLTRLLETHKRMKLRTVFEIRYEDEFLDAYNLTKKSMEEHKDAYEFFQTMQALMELGVFVKDPRIGLADFYSIFEDREIFLYPGFPEERILFWHGINEGYAERKSVDLLKEKI